MREANTDTTYCTNKECKDKCWRHESNFSFNNKKSYWFTNECIEKEGRKDDRGNS